MKRFSLVLSLLGAGLAHATDYYWIGDVSSDFEEPGNWRIGSAGGAVATSAPMNNSYGDPVYFTEAAVNKTVVFTIDRSVKSLNFVNTTGWDVTAHGRHSMDDGIKASGTGDIAVFHQAFEYIGKPLNATGGTLTLDFSMYFSGEGTITVGGGGNGCVRITGPIGGWSDKRCFKITADTTLRLDGSPTFSKNCRYVSLASAGAKFVFKGTVVGAESRFGKNANGSNGIINEYDPENSVLVARALDGDMAGYVEVSLMSPGDADLARDAEGRFVVTARNDMADAAMSVVADDGASEPIVIPLGDGVVPAGETVTAVLDESLAAATTYALTFRSVQSSGMVTKDLGVVYPGVPELSVVENADEDSMTPGILRISRSAASAHPLTVNYSFASEDATAGTDFIAPSGTAVIPEGKTFVDVPVMPLSNGAVKEDQSIVFSLAAGRYRSVDAVPVSMTIVNSQAEMPENVWIAGEGSDNLASNGANWSKGVPTADSEVLVSGLFSTNDIIWDAMAPVTVKSFLQTNYTGTVTFRTVYGTSGFTSFNVTGDCGVDSGTWTHPANGSAAEYRLNVTVGGNLTIGSSAMIDARKKGLSAGNCPEGGVVGLHGGGRGSTTATIGDVSIPELPGAGGKSASGGGAIKLQVVGDAVLNGKVRADAGENDNSWGAAEVGAGGSVYLSARTIAGTGTITVASPKFSITSDRAPSGGRVALVVTGSDTLDLPVANVSAMGTLSRDGASTGAGTILVKTRGQTYGTLYVRNRERGESNTYGITFPSAGGTTCIPAGQTWTLDGIVFSEAGIMSVPAGTTLRLPNGLASVTGSSKRAGLLMLGGTIDAGAENPYVLNGNWVLHGMTPYTFDRDVVVRDGAAIGTLRLRSLVSAPIRSTVAVNGNLTVESTGFLYASGTGINDNTDHAIYGGWYSHGGMPAVYGTDATKVYGSVLNPDLPGTFGYHDDSAGQYLGGGCLILTVRDTLTVDGKAVARDYKDGGYAYNAGGAGGTLNFTVGALAGSGVITADGALAQNPNNDSASKDTIGNRGTPACGGGGRIAIRLTKSGAVVPADLLSHITAYGGVYMQAGYQGGAATNSMASAGTVYIQNHADGEACGTVYFKNGSRAYNTACRTPFPSCRNGGEEDVLDKVSLSIGEMSGVSLSRDVKVMGVSIGADSKLDLCGRQLTTGRLQIDGMKFSPRARPYSADELGDLVTDSSESGTGAVLVCGTGFVLSVR